MTRNQIEYWANQEKERNNRAVEVETNRSNLAREIETNRHNLATESAQNRQILNDLQKISNDYYLGLTGQRETERSNKAREKENTRSAQAKEKEAILSRLQDRDIRRRQQSTADYNAYTNRLTAEEQHRANVARESNNLLALVETERSNRAREEENYRSNVSNENIRRYSNTIDQQRANEQRRSNRANESIAVRGQNFRLITDLANLTQRSLSSASGKIAKTLGGY